ncbi:MAG: L,D-transpeptidase [Anaerolineales bacterium]|nr:L,D-transpeptidase [Anaerolineales bacterium]
MKKLSRRDFIKLSGLGMASLLAPPLNFDFDESFPSQPGRVTTRTIWLYEQPSFQANRLKIYPKDSLLTITNTAVSDDTSSHNRIWYEIGTDGYAYSGNVQPVQTLLNTPQLEIPKEGLLAEVSVPFTDAHENPDAESKVIYRMYFETTHWIKSVVVSDIDGQVWYQVRDDKWDKLYYVRAEHLRIFTVEELAPISPEVPNREKKIVVRLDSQIVIAYEFNQPVFVVPAATGGILRSGTYTTPQGNFSTYFKRPSRHMAAGDLASNGFDLPGVPWVQYFTKSGVAFHGTFWHNDFGRPRSHGCINLANQNAKWLYLWTMPEVPFNKEMAINDLGTKIQITT